VVSGANERSRPPCAANVPESLYPFASHWHDRGDGLAMHYLDEGPRDAPPVVMVHGNPSWSFYFRALVRALRETHRVLVPDHIGCGFSDKPGDDRYAYTLRTRVDDLEGWLDAVGATKGVTLVVHDWGGMIGLGAAVRRPERIARIVLLNTAAFHLPKSKALPGRLRLARDTSLGALLVERFNAFSRGAAFFGVKRPLPPDVARALTAPYDTPANRIATLRFVQDIPLAPTDRAYGTVSETAAKLGVFANTPILVCWGAQDFVFDDHFLDEWRRIYPRAEVEYYLDAGHYVLEDAADRIVPRVQRFLAATP
jgi:pimeloyl-ACP methyl ester carboxylesterase